MKRLLVLLLAAPAYAGMIDSPDPIETTRQRADCSRRCEVYSDARERGICKAECEQQTPRAAVPNVLKSRGRDSTLYEFRNETDRDPIVRPNWIDHCESEFACPSLGGMCAHFGGVVAVAFRNWRDSTPEYSTTSCSALCATGKIFESVCDRYDQFQCTARDYYPCGRCFVGPTIPGQCGETVCDLDPEGCS